MIKFNKKINDEKLGLFLAISSSIFISIEILVIDYLYRFNPSINFFEMLFWSYSGVILFGSMFFLSSKKSINNVVDTFREYRQLLFKDSIISVIAVSFYYLGISMIGSSSTSIFLRASIIFTILFSLILLKEKLTLKEGGLIVLMIFGFLLYQENYEIASLFGVFVVLTSTFLYSLINYFIKKKNNNHNSFYYSYLRQILILGFSSIIFILFLRYRFELDFIGWKDFEILTLGSFCGGIF